MAKLVYASHSKCDNFSFEGSSPSLPIDILILKFYYKDINMSLLVLGATGTLGRQIVKRALNEGFHVKCFVRNFKRAAFLKEWGAELIYGNLAVPETIPLTLYGITAIIDASTIRVNDIYDINQVDLHGKYILLQSAIKAKVKRYIFFSILNAHKYNNIHLINLKLKIEEQLIKSNLNYTVFNVAGFFQGIISQYAIPILDKNSVWITDKSISIAYINTLDIAKIVIKSLSVRQCNKKCFSIVGKKNWNSLEIIQICEKISGQQAYISYVPFNIIKIIKKVGNFFQWTWNISDRLAFIEVFSLEDNFNTSMKDLLSLVSLKLSEIESLESYLTDYFSKIMNKLKELNNQNFINNDRKIDNIKF